jgi:beta-lactam-binding protein with PASTA domain
VSLAAIVTVGACDDSDTPRVAPTSPIVEETLDLPTVEPPPRATVPDVVGLKLPAARRMLRDADLRPRVRKRPSSEPRGTVLSQRPLAGVDVRPGRSIGLVVAKPEPPPPPPPGDYSPPIPPGPDVDCAGGSGNGPRYEGQGDVPFGPFQVKGSDIYGLDGDGDGVGCE